jgi:MATE family multidrug resistance protein
VGAVFFLALILRPRFRKDYRTLSGWRFDPPLFARLLRFGLPTGLQYSLEVLAFALFMIIVGRIGADELAATALAFNLNMLVFLPMLGLSVGVASLVGRYLGADRPEVAERSTYSAFWLALGYIAAGALLYLFAPGLLLAPYAAGADPRAFAGVAPIAVALLRFVALYSFFDMMNLVFAAGLKGAGDTLYPLGLTVFLSWVAMLGPAYLAWAFAGAGVYVAWSAASAYVILLGLLMLRRFQQGRWKSMRVIEAMPPRLERVAGPEPV